MKKLAIFKSIILIVGSLFLYSCDKEEQNRILNYKKGVYLGTKDQKISKSLEYSLSQRVNRQNYN